MAMVILPYSEIPKTMIEAEFLSANEFRVCAVLHSYSFMKHIFPSQEELEKKCNLTDRTVRTVISHLEEEGILVKFDRTTDAGRFTTNEYKFSCGGWNEWYCKTYGKTENSKLTGKKVEAEDISKDDETKIEVLENKLPYVRIYNDFLCSERLNSNELRVFLYFKQFANCNEIYPSYATLCKKTNLSKPTVINAITSLSFKGLVTKLEVMHEDGGKGANRYLILNDEELKGWLKA